MKFGIALARAITPRLSIGTTSKYFDYNTEMAGEEDADGFALDVGMVFRAAPTISIGVVGHNLIAEESSQYPRAVGVGVSMRPAASLGPSADGVWNLDAEEGETGGRFGGGGEYFYRSAAKTSGYPLRVGGVYDSSDSSTWVTGGIGYTNPKLGIDIGARKQVEGGDELLILASLRLFTVTQ